jgi:hypothetical protein
VIRFALDSPEKGPGYVLVAEETRDSGRTIRSDELRDVRALAMQARELADAAASILEDIPECAQAFERLHDALDALPGEPT